MEKHELTVTELSRMGGRARMRGLNSKGRSDLARRAARTRWGLCLECGEKLGTVKGLEDRCFGCRFEAAVHFAGLEPAG